MTSRKKIRVLIVDDSAIVRQTMTAILEEDPDIEVMATAADPFTAARRMEKKFPMSSRSTSRCREWMASPSCAS